MARVLLCLSLLGLLGGCAPGGSGLAARVGCALGGASCAQPAPPPAPYCTRSLANVDCWADPRRLADRPPQVADGGWQAPALVRPTLGASAPASGQGQGQGQDQGRGAAVPAADPPRGRPDQRRGTALPPGGG